MKNKIKELILSGNTLNDIYIQLPTTKTMINNVFKSIDCLELTKNHWLSPRREIEKALFSLHRKYQYFRDVYLFDKEMSFDFVLFEDAKPKLAILYLGPEFLVCNASPVYEEAIYNSVVCTLNKKADICRVNNIPLFILPILEIFDNPFLASDMREALKDYNYAEKHNKKSMEEYLDVSSIYTCSYDNYYEVKGSDICGCYNCGTVIKSSEIKTCNDDHSMACPVCKDFSVITESQGFCINEKFMQRIKMLYEESD